MKKLKELSSVGEINNIKLVEAEGWRLLNAGQYDEAIKVFDEVFKKDPLNVGAFQGQIASLRKNQNFDEAEKLLEKALQFHSNHLGILKERVWIHLDQKKHIEALKGVDEILKLYKSDEDVFLLKISLLREQRQFEEAEKLIREASGMFPKSLGIYNERGWLQFYQKHYDDAMETFKAIVKIDQANEVAIQGQIACLRMKGHFGQARNMANEALTKNDKSPGLRSESGWLNFEQGYFQKAEEDFEKALSLKTDAFSHVNLAWSIVRQDNNDDLERAAYHCREALQLDPNLAQAFGCLGIINFKQGRIREAETYLVRSIQVDSKRGHYTDLGALYIQMERYEDAKNILEKALQNNPDDAYAHIQMGTLFLQTERVKEATREFRWAVALDPNNLDSCKALAIVLMENNKLMEAQKVLRNAIRSLDHFRRWELHLVLCQVLTRLGDETDDLKLYGEALNEAIKAIRLNSQNTAPYFHAGVVQFKLGDYAGALKKFRRSQSKDQNNLQAELNIKRIRFLSNGEKARTRASLFGSVFLAFIFSAQLVALWIFRIKMNKISDTMLTILVPILLGLIALAVLLPWLKGFKMTGLEVELTELNQKDTLASGPKGEIGFENTSPWGG